MDTSIITILVSALGGALVSSLTGFLTIYFNNKHSFRMAKEKDKYEYGQYTNRMLYRYLEELERESQLMDYLNVDEMYNEARKCREKIRVIYSLAKPFLNDDTIICLCSYSNKEMHSFENAYSPIKEKASKSGRVSGKVNINSDDRDRINTWLASLSKFRKNLVASIQEELREIKNSRI